MTAPLLDVRDLTVTLPTAQGRRAALRGVSFTLSRGATLGLVGESGCGKSLTALALMGLLPDGAQVTGSIRFDGRELTTLDDEAMGALRGDRIGMVFQEPMTALNPVHRIGDQIAESLRLHKQMNAAAARAEALRLAGARATAAGARDGSMPIRMNSPAASASGSSSRSRSLVGPTC